MTEQANYFENSFHAGGTPDPITHPDAYRGILAARVFAFFADMAILFIVFIAVSILSGILGLFTFGLLNFGGLLLPIVFFAYFTITLGAEDSATPGMKWQGIEMRTWKGTRPSYLQAFIHTVLFYVTGAVSFLLYILVPIFNARRRCLHDYLSGSVFVWRRALPG